MAPSVFVCHAKSDIEATSEIIDLIEIALELPHGSIASSSLPGYSSDTRSEAELTSMLQSARVVIALATDKSAMDVTFAFELGAAWALGIRLVPLLIGSASLQDLPWPLRGVPAVRPHDHAAWLTLVEDLAHFLGVRVRVASAARVALDEVAARTSIAAPASSVGETSEIVTIAPRASQPKPTRELAFEAGRAMSDCLWNREAALDFARELSPQFGRFIDALGGSWQDLKQLQDFEVWTGTTDNLIEGLPPEQREVGPWYELGYELSTLHNLVSEGEIGSAQDASDREGLWRETLERLIENAEAAHIRYEDIARVLAQLENLSGPQSSRDYTNVGRTLDELRGHAVNADRLTSAA